MHKSNRTINNKNRRALDSYLGYHRSWWNYYHNYKNIVDDIVISITERDIPIDTVSLPLMFLIRHSLELGLKANILSFQKLNMEVMEIDLRGAKSHGLEYLSTILIDHLNCIKNKYKINLETLAQMDNYLAKFIPLIEKLHKLDKASFSFRYPVDTKGNSNITWDVRENISDIINLFEEIQPFLLYTEAVLIDEGVIELAIIEPKKMI